MLDEIKHDLEHAVECGIVFTTKDALSYYLSVYTSDSEIIDGWAMLLKKYITRKQDETC